MFGADDFCQNCRICTDACPPDAIAEQKQLVRGDEKWFVDFDRCIPYFAETKGCAICIARCPWSRPGIADNLLVKMARRRERHAAADSWTATPGDPGSGRAAHSNLRRIWQGLTVSPCAIDLFF